MAPLCIDVAEHFVLKETTEVVELFLEGLTASRSHGQTPHHAGRRRVCREAFTLGSGHERIRYQVARFVAVR